MRKNWPFRAGLALIPACGLAYIAGLPPVLAILSVGAMGCLVVGLFGYALSPTGALDLFFLAVATAFLLLVAGRALIAAIEGIATDASAGGGAVGVILFALVASFAAFVYGIVRRIRNRRPAR